MLSSCKITQEFLWSDVYKEDFKEFAIGDDGRSVILVGKKYHYLFGDESGDLKRIIDSQVISKIKNLQTGVFSVDASSKRTRFDLRVASINADLLSDDEKKVFQKLRFSEPNNNSSDYNYHRFYESLQLQGARYLPTPKDTYKIHPLNLAEPFDEYVQEKQTPLKTTGKVLLTPFAVVADILMIPLYLIGTIGMVAAQ